MLATANKIKNKILKPVDPEYWKYDQAKPYWKYDQAKPNVDDNTKAKTNNKLNQK